MKKNIKKKFSIKKILYFILNLITIITSLLCIYNIYKLDILPNKHLLLFSGLFGLLNFIAIIFIIIKNKICKFIGIFFSIILIIVSGIAIKYATDTDKFLNESFNNVAKEYIKYSVIVSSNSTYAKIEELKDSRMGYLFIDNTDKRYLDTISDIVNVTLEMTDVVTLYDNLINGKYSSIVINNAYIDLLETEISDFSANTKILYDYQIEVIKENENTTKVDKLESINIYLSGSDSRQGIINNTLSDVNIIMTINPKTNKILLTNVPRDYYVQLDGTTGTKDKLTHAGFYGIDMSKKTLGNLFDIKIDYSIKIGFNGVVKMVDLVGGVDINSDTYVKLFDGKKYFNVNKGMNHFDGAEALAYSRERKSYQDGDRHRGRNQQQVIEAVLKKIMTDKSLLLKYDTLLNSFKELYVSDIPRELISMYIKNQLENMNGWEIEMQEVTGYDSGGYTYSMPGWYLYVMEPDMDSVNTAKNKIKNVINGIETTENIIQE